LQVGETAGRLPVDGVVIRPAGRDDEAAGVEEAVVGAVGVLVDVVAVDVVVLALENPVELEQLVAEVAPTASAQASSDPSRPDPAAPRVRQQQRINRRDRWEAPPVAGQFIAEFCCTRIRARIPFAHQSVPGNVLNPGSRRNTLGL